MANFIDALVNIDNKYRRKIKPELEKLDDRYVIRSCVLAERTPAQVVIEGPGQSLLLLSCHESMPATDELHQYSELAKKMRESGFSNIPYLAIVADYDATADLFYKPIDGVVIVDKEDFLSRSQFFIAQAIINCREQHFTWLKTYLFPESMIIPGCTTRVPLKKKSNLAQLQTFFLDYDQELATKLDLFDDERTIDDSDDYSVRLINGVAGSGKTLILINRAILYCKLYPERHTLLLIPNKPVTKDIKFKLKKYLGAIPDNLEVQTFHAFALAQKRKACSTKCADIIFDIKNEPVIVEEFLSDKNALFVSLNLTVDKIVAEFEYINDHLIENENAYLEIERQGRGFSLQQSQRKLLWLLYEEMMARLNSNTNGYLASLFIRELCLDKDAGDKLTKYDHILLDEAQFFFPSWLQLVKQSLPANGQLFMCADPNQGFLKTKLSWKSVGLNVRGRTKKLNHSYRTTVQILKAANALIESLEENTEDYLKPDFDKMETGAKPTVIYSLTPQDEQLRFLNELERCVRQNEVPMHQILILFSDFYKLWSLKKSIEARLGRGTVIDCKNDEYTNLNENSLKLVSINSCTGLESGVTFVLGVGAILNKEKNVDLIEEESNIIKNESYRKLYVAMTRAGQKLLIFSTVRLPESVAMYVDEG
ncbi:MAG: UvrD-helicase domain-containing protein [Pseudomonadota bacterium]